MATVDPDVKTLRNGQALEIVWEGLGQGDDGAPVDIAEYSEGACQVIGTFSTGTITLQGSSARTPSWSDLKDPVGNTIAAVADTENHQIGYAPRWIRPNVNSGDVSTDLTVTVILRRPFSPRA